jgi:hypothetical protein
MDPFIHRNAPSWKELASRLLLLAMIGVFLALVSGCVSTRAVGKPIQTNERKGCGWWLARIRVYWPEGEAPRWPMDLLLAHRVVAPILERHENVIPLWRFHRRAARDQWGHQFSFIFYSTSQTAKEVFHAMRTDQTLAELKTAGLVLSDDYDDTTHIAKPNLQDTSDKHWSPSLQKCWPYFIMGASRMWLALIDEAARARPCPPESASPWELKAYYGGVNDTVEAVWQKEGKHAFLHHLNAIFGYEPLLMPDGNEMAF